MNYRVPFIAFCLFISVRLFAQNSGPSPLDFNNTMADIMVTLSKKGNEWNQRFAQLDTTTKKFSELAPLRHDLEIYIDWKIAELRGMKDIKGSGRFRQAMIDFLVFEKGLIHKSFSAVENLKPTSTDAEVQKALDYFINGSSKESMQIKNIKAAQKEYADRNHFSVDDAQ